MEEFRAYLEKVENPAHRARMEQVFTFIMEHFPHLARRMGYSQPIFTDHGTFIVSFSMAKDHLSVAPEETAMERFADDIQNAGYSAGKMLYRMPWDKPVDYDLLGRVIAFNIQDKKNLKAFWRRKPR